MKAKNSEGKRIMNYVNPFLPLMPLPIETTEKEEQSFSVCGYCGGRSVNNGKKRIKINGIMVHPEHKDCQESARHPLFDMNEAVLRTK